MGQFEKFLNKLRRIPKDISFKDLHFFLTHNNIGWKFRCHGGSHYTYYITVDNEDIDIITIPNHHIVKPIYIKKVLDKLDEQGIFEDE